MKRQVSILSILVLLGGMPFVLTAQGGRESASYPTKAITIIVQAGAGGSSDVNCRTIAPGLQDALGKPVIVENKPGGGGGIAISYGASQKPDGYVINHLPIDLVMLKPFGFASVGPDDFELLCRVAYHGAAVAVRADSSMKTLSDFIEAAKNKPATITVGNSGIGAIWHLAAVQLENATGAKFSHIPFEGAAPSVAALLGGHVDSVVCSPMEVGPQVKSGALRLLSIFYDQRMKMFPDVPTLKEQGINLSSMVWLGFGVPKGTPKNVCEKLVVAFKKSYDSPLYQDMLSSRGLEPGWMGSDDFASFVKKEYQVYSELVPKVMKK